MQNVKGTYDFFGKEQAIRKKVQSVLQEVFELYDFDGMDSTILTELDLLTSKYAGGDEILKEMYQLTDQGMRNLGLRYDLTIPFAKVIALNPGIEIPFKRYEIGKVFRDGPVKRGRLREFLQCDIDVVGIEGLEAEAELMQVAFEVFKRLDLQVTLRWNNRKFLGEILETVGVTSEEKLSVMLSLDKIEKIGNEGVIKELISKGLSSQVTNAITGLIEMDEPTLENLFDKYKFKNSEGSSEVFALQELIVKLELDKMCKFDPFLSRGLSFYTGTVYEIFDANKIFASSLGGGGRYDAIIGKLVGRDDIQYPTVGISFGMESIMEMLKSRPIQLPQPLVVVISIGETSADVLKAAAILRSNGIRTSIETSKRKLKKSLATAASNGIPYVILIGEDEAKDGLLRLKDMKEKNEKVVTVQEAVNRILQQQSKISEGY
ncbi:histidine--tRNA ligase [Paenibacillus aceris]|uniref:Histidine--tRNA ligase n=1 Tax=Paenibacillus aceris TaxID=869555 RepID=A0ABS4HY00_9BACL|nr:histidine--tRNA ligase [Paenibacillus aceris]MBP1963365.1 histidyl-tRNA synthetase [Paenibacillus aceris]NHW36129.1 histidine--tRNA ligase [Paenibacillus aceris]